MATHEYNGTTEELDVTVGQAFENENSFARWPRSMERATYPVNEQFRIKQMGNMFKVQYCINGEWQTHQIVIALNGTSQDWWCFSYEDAMALVEAFMTLFNWMGGIVAASPALSDEEAFEQMMWEAREEKCNALVGRVIYYTDLLDKQECVGRLISFDRDGMWLEDPTPPTHPQWFPHSMVANITRGRQTGWD